MGMICYHSILSHYMPTVFSTKSNYWPNWLHYYLCFILTAVLAGTKCFSSHDEAKLQSSCYFWTKLWKMCRKVFSGQEWYSLLFALKSPFTAVTMISLCTICNIGMLEFIDDRFWSSMLKIRLFEQKCFLMTSQLR